MGSSMSTTFSPPPSTSQLQVKDALALCEDGDLLLAREKLADAALRVGVDFVVARDIQRMQRGEFPAQRVTSLPPWTSCEVLLRHEGALHAVTVGANGLQLLPFEERIASRMPQIHDRFAIRRLRHDARNESLSAALRDLVLQIASVAPVSWQSLLLPITKAKISPRSPRQQPVDREAEAGAPKELPPLVQHMLRRMLKGLKPCEARADKLQQQNPSINSSDHTNAPSKGEDEASTALRAALETLGVAEVTARLSAAFVAALYEHIHLVDRISATRNDALLPAAFWSGCNEHERLIFTPPTAVGAEMALARPTLEQNTYSLAK
ncbi:hypothetical protein KRP22_012959 [Phytophthora ramorum]|nr:hypothetical protein KRP22_8611 [Phytophthora ramorum]